MGIAGQRSASRGATGARDASHQSSSMKTGTTRWITLLIQASVTPTPTSVRKSA